MDDSPVRRLVNQCAKSNDIDAKVDAITKLQAEFEAGTEIPDPDALVQVLKACLRISNQHLTTATLSALPPCIPLLVTRHPAQIPLPSSSTSPAASTSSATSSPVDAHALRQVLTQLMPAGGGVVDRLGDSRERAREKARETLVVMGGFAFRAGSTGSHMGRSRDGKGPESPLHLFERFLREGGMTSKVARVREQAILTLVHVRRTHHLFPLRPYLPHLVDAMEDTDPTVRECAKQSVVELFTGPGVTDAARADLKKEMAKKGVRKTIADGILARVLAGGAGASTPGTLSDAGSENGDLAGAAREYVPPSIALMNRRPGPTVAGTASGTMSRVVSQGNVRSEIPRPASRAAVMSPSGEGPSAAAGAGSDAKAVYIASSRDLENEFASMLRPFEGKETEHNWADRERAIQRVRGMLKGDVHERYTDTFLHGLKNGFMEASLKTLASLRTTVSANTCALYSELAIALGTALDPFCDLLYTNLLRMANLTKKIAAQISQATVATLIQHTSAQPKTLLPLFWNTLQDKAINTRAYVVAHVKTFLEVHGARSAHAIESHGAIDHLEKIVKKALGDANAGVRDSARQVFWIFHGIWPERGTAILHSLESVARKQLEKACPNPDALAGLATVTTPPKTKKSSVAAAIAASRAKAKAIATAPPSLRHQATSTSHTIRATSPPTRRPTSPALSTSSSTSAVRATSPVSRSSPPRSRILSGGTISRSTSANVVLSTSTSTPRSPPRQAQSGSPPSPTPDQTFHRRLSSPRTPLSPSPPTSNSTFRKAVETALPASPVHPVTSLAASPTPRPPKVGAAAVPVFHRESLSIAGLHQLAGSEEESLLLATNIPVPEDSDSDMDMDESVNLISFSTPYEVYPPAPRSTSQANSFSPVSTGSKRPLFSNALSTGTSSPPAGVVQPIVEDAMRARAEQAESAAERLLELVEPEEEDAHPSPLPAALLLRNGEGQGGRPKPRTSSESESSVPTVPKTPINRRSAAIIMQRAALFQDSPAYNGKSSSLFSMVDGRDSARQWWAKRMALLKMPTPHEDSGTPDREETLRSFIAALEQDTADVAVLTKLAQLCIQNPVIESLSPVSPAFSAPLTPSPLDGSARQLAQSKSAYWTQDRLFDQLFNALVRFLDPLKNAEELEYGLIVLWEMLENQAPLLEGREADIFGVLLQIRYCGQMNVMQATNFFRDTLTSRIEPVYGLTTLHAALRAFRDAPLPPSATTEIRDGTYAFGLIALGKFFLRLPAEVLEEELPRLRSTLISALTESSGTSALAVREAATAATIAAQMILRDETHLFTLLDGLPDEKKNLLTYMFDKHGARGPTSGAGMSPMDKLEREMRRIDGRLSTPRRV
ncbi:clasp N terminal-domain-containing protein [Dichomitus squalens]|uniref:Clasp N terminal-domain-containing protein n=1 Tax=Dichomitus squalens TaxID=114155 RepID=A0A4Q9PW54_9APHY|nr:clasp N terminal-domain-containing protein [Dichomitus squalens]